MSATNNYKVKLVLSIIEEHFGSITKVSYVAISHSLIMTYQVDVSRKNMSMLASLSLSSRNESNVGVNYRQKRWTALCPISMIKSFVLFLPNWSIGNSLICFSKKKNRISSLLYYWCSSIESCTAQISYHSPDIALLLHWRKDYKAL